MSDLQHDAMTRRHPAGTIERDLCNLVSERVCRAVMSVVQLTNDPHQHFVIASTAEAAVSGILAGAYMKMTDQPAGSADPVDVAIAVLLSVQEAAKAETDR